MIIMKDKFLKSKLKVMMRVSDLNGRGETQGHRKFGTLKTVKVGHLKQLEKITKFKCRK